MTTDVFEIEDREEQERGCGFRKPGGTYLVSAGVAAPCGKLTIPLTVCPCCSTGIKPSRGWTWVNGTALIAGRECQETDRPRHCGGCPLAIEPGRIGLLWIGEKFYPRPSDFSLEAAKMGVSRRLAQIPRDFKLGETVVWMAHRKAIQNPDESYTAAVVFVFRPSAIEYVVREDDEPEKLARLVKRGITLVRVHHAEKTGEPLAASPACLVLPGDVAWGSAFAIPSARRKPRRPPGGCPPP